MKERGGWEKKMAGYDDFLYFLPMLLLGCLYCFGLLLPCLIIKEFFQKIIKKIKA